MQNANVAIIVNKDSSLTLDAVVQKVDIHRINHYPENNKGFCYYLSTG